MVYMFKKYLKSEEPGDRNYSFLTRRLCAQSGNHPDQGRCVPRRAHLWRRWGNRHSARSARPDVSHHMPIRRRVWKSAIPPCIM